MKPRGERGLREAVRLRRSVGSFTPEGVTEPGAALLKDALVWAPSSGNLQKRAFSFVYARDVKSALAIVGPPACPRPRHG